MAEEPENHTIRLLQELRSDIAELRGDVAEVRTRLDGNTLILNFLAGSIHNHERRIDALETAPRA